MRQNFDVWRYLAYIVGLQIEITNTTDNLIRLGSIGIGSDWRRNPRPGDLPVIDDSDRQALRREVDARRTDRYTPELRCHSSIPPHESISGWAATWMPRPPAGVASKLTLSIHEAVGRQYLLAVALTDPQMFRSGRIAAGQPDAAVEDYGQSTPNTADVLAERFGAEWAADISLFTKLKNQPSFREVSTALRRGAELGLISKHGIRAPLEFTSAYLRIPHPGDWPSDSLIPLHLEERWLEEISVHEWTSDESFVGASYSIATKLGSTLHWKGEASYNPDETFYHFAALLLYGIETIRKGYSGVINRMLQIVRDDWVITEWEIVDKTYHYHILLRRFSEMDWTTHITEKSWVNRSNFLEAFETAQMLIYRQIFEGQLPPSWTPPKNWPSGFSVDSGTGGE